MPAPTFVGFSGSSGDISISAGADETGILLDQLNWSIDNPMVNFFDRYGGVIGYAQDFNASLNLEISGEVNDVATATGGINVLDYTSACTIANGDFFDEDTGGTAGIYHGIAFTGDPYLLMEASGGQPRGGGRTIQVSVKRYRGFALS